MHRPILEIATELSLSTVDDTDINDFRRFYLIDIILSAKIRRICVICVLLNQFPKSDINFTLTRRISSSV
jgi:hypothetical protein